MVYTITLTTTLKDDIKFYGADVTEGNNQTTYTFSHQDVLDQKIYFAIADTNQLAANPLTFGGAGNDRLLAADDAGAHNTLIGGADADVFFIALEIRVTDVIKDFTPDDGDKIRFVYSKGGDSDSLDVVLSDLLNNHQSTTIEDYQNDGTMDTVMKFNPYNRTSNEDHYYTLVLEGFTAPLLFDHITAIESLD